jgi:hypothetical protein
MTSTVVHCISLSLSHLSDSGALFGPMPDFSINIASANTNLLTAENLDTNNIALMTRDLTFHRGHMLAVNSELLCYVTKGKLLKGVIFYVTIVSFPTFIFRFEVY